MDNSQLGEIAKLKGRKFTMDVEPIVLYRHSDTSAAVIVIRVTVSVGGKVVQAINMLDATNQALSRALGWLLPLEG